MNLAPALALISFALLATPFVVYFSVKFGVFAYWRARQLFDETSKKGDRKSYDNEK